MFADPTEWRTRTSAICEKKPASATPSLRSRTSEYVVRCHQVLAVYMAMRRLTNGFPLPGRPKTLVYPRLLFIQTSFLNDKTEKFLKWFWKISYSACSCWFWTPSWYSFISAVSRRIADRLNFQSCSHSSNSLQLDISRKHESMRGPSVQLWRYLRDHQQRANMRVSSMLRSLSASVRSRLSHLQVSPVNHFLRLAERFYSQWWTFFFK